jgi:hypothetical protein
MTVGELGHRSDLGYLGRGSVAVMPAPASAPTLRFLAELGYSRFPSGVTTGGDFAFAMVGGGLKLSFDTHPDSKLYLSARTGYAYTKMGDGETTPGTRLRGNGFVEHNPYLAFGLGVDSRSFFAEAGLTNVFGTRIKNYTFIPVTLGVRF